PGRKPLTTDTGKEATGEVVGVDARGLDLFHYRVTQGRRFDGADMDGHARVCIVADKLADRLFGKGENVVGRTVSFLGMHCQIIGRLARMDRWGVGFGWEWDEELLLPLETLSDHDDK